MIIGLYLRHLKIYKGINYIPIGADYNFVSYLGENGSGKSSILEALDSFFNNKDYSINKTALKSIRTKDNSAFITPIFLIEKSRISKSKNELEKISEYFWAVKQDELAPNPKKYTREFFELRDSIDRSKYTPETHYLFLLGEDALSKKVYFSSFQKEPTFQKHLIDEFSDESDCVDGDTMNEIVGDKLDEMFKKLLDNIKKTYSYVYIPVEIDVQDFTKIETAHMQKVFGTSLKKEITSALDDELIDGLNSKLNNYVDQIEKTLCYKYFYDSEKGGNSKKYIKDYDLFDKILEVYFKIRVLKKGESTNRTESKKVSELSAGEKRQALIDVVYAAMKNEESRDENLIIAIDEPENSLHNSLCYEQFEKLKEISSNNQVLITTHWYGFLPIVSEGIGHFLTNNNESADDKIDVGFDSYSLYGYNATVKHEKETSKGRMPKDFYLKSTNDLVQSIFYSLQGEDAYNWLICEGISEKIYFEYFFRDEIKESKLRILPMGGNSGVVKIYEYLQLPIKNDNENLLGNVYCLIDTDPERFKDSIGSGFENLKIRRLCNTENLRTDLVALNNSLTNVTCIENALHPQIFKKVLSLLQLPSEYVVDEIRNSQGNTCFIKNFENYRLNEFFGLNNGENKILFANKYIEVMKSLENPEQYYPNWINEVKAFYKKAQVKELAKV